MELGQLYAVTSALSKNENEVWKREILSVVNIEEEILSDVPLEALVLAVYACFDHNFYVPNLKIICYGAGKMAQKYIPEICEIWDAYSHKTEISSIPVVKPENSKINRKVPLMIFIDDQAVRSEVMSLYRTKGYQNLFYFRDYLSILKFRYVFDMMKSHTGAPAKELIDHLFTQYEMIDSTACVPVLFAVLGKNMQKVQLSVKTTPGSTQLLESRLASQLTVDRMPENVLTPAVRSFFQNSLTNAFGLACALEKLLRKILSNHVKTLERPMRMADDHPYDEFAVAAVVNAVMDTLFETYTNALDVVQLLRKSAEASIPLIAVECTLLAKHERYTDALKLAIAAVKKAPNDLLANETFYQIAVACTQQEIDVEEPVPRYDLSERFCWSGLNFAWCGGFDAQTGLADFGPCFRPLQCAARPDGDFWRGEDWKEFRRSVTDGSFRYCQKSQCPNIVAGCPKKVIARRNSSKNCWTAARRTSLPLKSCIFPTTAIAICNALLAG